MAWARMLPAGPNGKPPTEASFPVGPVSAGVSSHRLIAVPLRGGLRNFVYAQIKMKTQQTLTRTSVLASSAIVAAMSAQGSADYGPAIWNPPGCVKYYTSG